MEQERYRSLQEFETKMMEELKSKCHLPPPPGMKSDGKPDMYQLTSDLSVLCIFIAEAISKVNEGGKSRCRSLAVTKLEEARMWLNEELRDSP